MDFVLLTNQNSLNLSAFNMKLFKLLLLFAVWIFAYSAFSQTQKIGHKSHSGSVATFAFQEDGGYGLPPQLLKVYELDCVVKYLDTCVIEIFTKTFSSEKYMDTLCENNQYRYMNLADKGVIDSLKQNSYFRSVEFIGFEVLNQSSQSKENSVPIFIKKPKTGNKLPLLFVFISLVVAILFWFQYKVQRNSALS
jgi:hypothetical protein